MHLLTCLFVVVLVLHIIFASFLIQSPNASQYLRENLKEETVQQQQNATVTSKPPGAPETAKNQEGNENITSKQSAEISSTPEIVEDQEDNENITSDESLEDSAVQSQTDPETAQTENNLGWGIYSNNPDLEVYYDSTCTQTSTSINLGAIAPGSSITNTIYIKNLGDKSLTLSLRTKNWDPSNADGPVALTWNLEGTVLSPNQTSAATLTLNVSPNIEGVTTFSFEVEISGTE